MQVAVLAFGEVAAATSDGSARTHSGSGRPCVVVTGASWSASGSTNGSSNQLHTAKIAASRLLVRQSGAATAAGKGAWCWLANNHQALAKPRSFFDCSDEHMAV